MSTSCEASGRRRVTSLPFITIFSIGSQSIEPTMLSFAYPLLSKYAHSIFARSTERRLQVQKLSSTQSHLTPSSKVSTNSALMQSPQKWKPSESTPLDNTSKALAFPSFASSTFMSWRTYHVLLSFLLPRTNGNSPGKASGVFNFSTSSLR